MRSLGWREVQVVAARLLGELPPVETAVTTVADVGKRTVTVTEK